MSKKIKDAILYIGLFYMIVVVILTIINYCSMTTTIELSGNDYKQQIELFKEKVASIENKTCKNYFTDLIEKVNRDISIDKINLQEYYNIITSENSILNYYSKAIEQCEEITQEKMNSSNMPLKFITASIQNDEILDGFIYQYELGFKDLKIRKVREKSLLGVENNIRIQNELQIIEELINIVNLGKGV